MLGSIFLSLSFGSALVALLAYVMAIRGGQKRWYTIGRFGFHASVISFMIASAFLMYFILTHQFQYDYIWSHSSRHLSQPLLVASFYAGQQGSFMLWTLLTSLIGVFVLGFASRVRYEAQVMAPLLLVLICLLLILHLKSPFDTIFAAHPADKLAANLVPADGRGLNPQLENIWITIHPPILFTGFAAMTVPFIFAIAGLIKRDYQRWVVVSLPWALFASMVLGFGVMLGGWWAYETLGWGGFWAWDPVENSSLIPWLFCVAMVHTMLVQKRTGSVPTRRGDAVKVGGLVKTNFVLAVVSFGMVLYSTFLTRSGILGDTSVHSFVSGDDLFLKALFIFNAIFVALGVGLVLYRWRDLRQSPFNFPLLSRENALGLGSAVLCASAVIVVLGTSWPIFSDIFGMPKVSVPPELYNTLQLPLALVIALLNGLSLRVKWKNTKREDFFRHVGIAAAVAALLTVLLVVAGIQDPLYLAVGYAALLALVVNAHTGYQVIRGNPRFIGAYVSHMGVSLLLLGIIFTARYSVTQHVRLVQGKPADVFGYSVLYTGAEQIELEKTDREKFQHVITMTRDGSSYQVKPVVFWSDFNKRESAFLEPGILYTATRDIYLSPKALDLEGGDPRASLRKGMKTPIPFDSSVVVRFEKFDMSRAQAEGMQGAVMQVTHGDSAYFLTSYRTISGDRSTPVAIPGTDYKITMVGLDADKENLANSQVQLMFSSPSHPYPPPKRAITLDISIKPFISFVWAGVIIMVGGFFFSMVRRWKEVTGMRMGEEETIVSPVLPTQGGEGFVTPHPAPSPIRK